MSDMLALVGRFMNLAALGSGVTSSSFNLLYPPGNLVIGNPSKPWMALNSITPQYVTVDLNHRDNDNGSMENWASGVPVGWAKAQNPISPILIFQETNPAHVYDGLSSVRFEKNSGANYALIHKVFEVPSGSFWVMRMRVKGAKANSRIYVQNVDTGNFLTGFTPSPGGVAAVWSASPVHFHTFTTSILDPSNYVLETTSVFQVEDGWELEGSGTGQDPTFRDVTKLRIMIGWDQFGTPSGTFWLDAFTLFSVPDFASVHYHGFRSNDVLRVQGSNIGATFADLATFDFGRQANRRQDIYTRWNLDHSALYRYLRIRGDAPAGFNVGGEFLDRPAWMGEALFGQAKRLKVHELFPGGSIGHDWPQYRDSLGVYAYAQQDEATRTRSLTLQPRAEGGNVQRSEEIADVLLNLYGRSRAGAYPAVIVPDDTAPDVFFGRFDPGLSLDRDNWVLHKTGLVLTGIPVPTFL